LQGYIEKSKKAVGKLARGILVHGGAKKVDEKVFAEAQKFCIEIFQYKLDVDLAESC
jgi:hypothetical protein